MIMYVLHTAMTDACFFGTRLHVQFAGTNRSVPFEALKSRHLIQCIHKMRGARRPTSCINCLLILCSNVPL